MNQLHYHHTHYCVLVPETPPLFDLQIAWLCPCNSHVNLVSEVNTEYCPHVWSVMGVHTLCEVKV